MVEDGGAVEEDGQRDGDEAGVVDADVLVDARERVCCVVGGGLLARHAVLGGDDADEADLVVRQLLVVHGAAEDVEGAEVAREVGGHAVVEGLRDGQHEA